MALSKDHTKEDIIKKILKAEATKRCYCKLRWLIHPPVSGVLYIQRDHHGSLQTIIDCFDLEQTILDHNQQHFNQCASTPFTVGALRQLNWAADSPVADDILDGKADLSE